MNDDYSESETESESEDDAAMTIKLPGIASLLSAEADSEALLGVAEKGDSIVLEALLQQERQAARRNGPI